MKRVGATAVGIRAALAACLCVSLVSNAQARGLLGLFADDREALPAPAVSATPPAEPIDPTRPIAWISSLRGVTDPAAQLYGYVPAGTRIDLGAQGEITLTWLSPCREESVVGGIVTIAADGPRVTGAPAARSRALSCRPLDFMIPGDGPVRRTPAEGPFDPETWYEIAVNSPEPVFWWPSPLGASAQLSMVDLDAQEPVETWSTRAFSGNAPYPHEAPPIEQGRPYLIRATMDDGTTFRAVFSYDPDISFSSAAINTLVILRPQPGGAP